MRVSVMVWDEGSMWWCGVGGECDGVGWDEG